MRTTLTLEPDVARRVHQVIARKKLPLKRVVNEALRAGLAALDRDQPVKFSVDPHPCRFRAGFDLDKLNPIADEMEAEGSLSTLSR